MLQQLCAIGLLMVPFFAFGAWLMVKHGPVPTWSSMWDIACLSAIFLGLAMMADNVCAALRDQFKNNAQTP